MSKSRVYKYDNLKFLMIFFMVFAHFLELIWGDTSGKIYMFIYTFHIPVFVYISGYFSKGSRESSLNYTYIYIIWQAIYCVVIRITSNLPIFVNYVYPAWIMWYMLAMIAWNLIIKYLDEILVKKYVTCVIIFFVLSVIVGFFENVGYLLSLSRIVTFFPYFLLGYLNKKGDLQIFNLKKNGKINIKTVCFILIAAIISITYFLNNIERIKPWWLYGSCSYNIGGDNFVFKIMWILLSLVELFVLYNITTSKKVEFISSIGANTLNIYLLHGIIIKILSVYRKNIFIYQENINIIIAFVLSLIIVITLGAKVINKKMKCLTDVNRLMKKIQIQGLEIEGDLQQKVDSYQEFYNEYHTKFEEQKKS